MLRLLLDEDFYNDILRGLLRRLPRLDAVRVQDTKLAGLPDMDVLDWSMEHGRVLLTLDARTVPKYAFERLRCGIGIAGVLIVPQSLPVGRAIDELKFIVECSTAAEWIDRLA